MPEKNTHHNRRYLPMLNHVRGKRSAVTCALKCNNACLEPEANCSSNSYFKDVLESAISRRAALGVTAGAALVLGTGMGAPHTAQAASPNPNSWTRGKSGKNFSFQPIAPVASDVDEFTVPTGFSWDPIIRWGDPLFSTAPDFDPNQQNAYAQERQFGYNNDYLTIIPDANYPLRGILVCNHEYVNEEAMFPAEMFTNNRLELLRTAMMAQGLSVVELTRKKVGSPWTYLVDAPRNRRITTDTQFVLDGPAAGSPLLKTIDDPSGTRVAGTSNNCSGGLTPWGTVLSGEENFDSYFVGKDTPEFKRYTIKNQPSVHGWEDAEPRWNANNPGYANESNRFGYIVELDPQDPTAAPRKHTALGRFKHEGANIHVDPRTGQVAAYMGDDSKFEYIYKFVSHARYIEGNKAHNMTLLQKGSLYVARFTGNSEAEIDGSGAVPTDGSFDGTGAWIQLTDGDKSLVPGMSIDQVLVYTRTAADTMGATKMDRPEDVEPSPTTGKIYAALTNNTDRGGNGFAPADEANPRNNNRSGHLIEMIEHGNTVAAASFNWNLLLVCGDPEGDEPVYFSGFDPAKVSPISCPDNVAFDSAGNLWVSTDGAPDKIQKNDGLFRVGLEGANRGNVEQFLSVPVEAETCGPVIADQENMVYVAVQHPGEDGTFAQPHSYFPDYVAASSVETAPGTAEFGSAEQNGKGRGRGKGKKKGHGKKLSPVAQAHGTAALPRPSVVQVYKA